ncbi:unnamed protein product [Diamesa serratosioi]
MENTYLGFDLSTQKLKVIQLNEKCEVILQAEVKFDEDLKEFNTQGGVRSGDGKNEYYAEPVMWIKAIDIVLDRLILQGANLTSVVALSGSCQQHGSIYWNESGIETLQNLDLDKFLHTQLTNDCFTMAKTPIWMDSSTEKQCLELEEAVGGRDEMVRITGSKAYERFTAAQIRKISQNNPEAYANCVRISLVSSFLASIFLNDIAQIDLGDASGMNLLDINQKCWSKICINACADNLEEKLGVPVPTASVLGPIGNFFKQRYNFNANCSVVAFTGDNLSSFSGMNLGDNWLAFSLGTSDTIMMCLEQHPQLLQGHVLLHPTQDCFMGLLCFKNGSLVRDTFKRAEANNNWEHFSELLDSAPRGNGGYMALHYLTQEIIPNVSGTLRWEPSDTYENAQKKAELIQFPTQQIEIRALIEGQMLNRKAFALEMGFNFGEDTKILATGGSSSNKTILQVMADVFNCPVYIQKTPEAACLGAAYRAKYVHYITQAKVISKSIETYHDYIKSFCDLHSNQRLCDPHSDSNEIYTPMLNRYRSMVKIMLERQNQA